MTGRLVRRAAADDGDDSADEHERRQDHDRQQEDGLRLVRAHEDRGLLHVLGANRDLVFLLGQPAHGVEEEVAVALDVEELVRGNVGRAVHDDAGFVDRRDRRDDERPLQILCIGLGHAALEIRAVGLPPALCTGAREPLDVTPLGGVLSAVIDRVSGKRVLIPLMSRVIGWDSYCWTIGTSGPMPKRRPIGFCSTTRSSSSWNPYFTRYFLSPSFWNGFAMAKTLPPRPRYASMASSSGGNRSLRGPARMTTTESSGTLPARARTRGLTS